MLSVVDEQESRLHESGPQEEGDEGFWRDVFWLSQSSRPPDSLRHSAKNVVMLMLIVERGEKWLTYVFLLGNYDQPGGSILRYRFEITVDKTGTLCLSISLSNMRKPFPQILRKNQIQI